MFGFLANICLLVKVNWGLKFVLHNKELPHFLPLRKHMSPTPLHALFPEFEHVFSGMEMAVLALLRH